MNDNLFQILLIGIVHLKMSPFTHSHSAPNVHYVFLLWKTRLNVQGALFHKGALENDKKHNKNILNIVHTPSGLKAQDNSIFNLLFT